MLNSEINSIELGNSVTRMSTCHKQQPIATKKVALRDVQNNNKSFVRNGQESLLLVEKRPLADPTKICGTKRFAPEYTSTQPLSNNGTNEHFMYARRKYELEAGKGRIQGNTDIFPGYPQFTNIPPRQQEISSKQNHIKGKNMHHDCPKVEVPQFEGTNAQQREERFIRLQNFIKHCDMSNQRENIQLLRHLSPSELNRHAVELEKRAIQLTIEEGKEMQRMKALNILGKSATTNNPMQLTQQLQPKN